MNPLRVDEASRRRLNGSGSPLFFAFPTGNALETYDVRTHPGLVDSTVLPAQPSYFEDGAAGAKVEASTRWFTLGANAAGLYRKHADFNTTDPSKEHDRILNWSGTLNVPSILKHGDVYVEVAGQGMRDGHLSPNSGKHEPDLNGYAVYASASVTGGPVSFSLEGKHYRSFFPLSANIDVTTPGFSAPDVLLVTYSQPPTAEGHLHRGRLQAARRACASPAAARASTTASTARRRCTPGWGAGDELVRGPRDPARPGMQHHAVDNGQSGAHHRRPDQHLGQRDRPRPGIFRGQDPRQGVDRRAHQRHRHPRADAGPEGRHHRVLPRGLRPLRHDLPPLGPLLAPDAGLPPPPLGAGELAKPWNEGESTPRSSGRRTCRRSSATNTWRGSSASRSAPPRSPRRRGCSRTSATT